MGSRNFRIRHIPLDDVLAMVQAKNEDSPRAEAELLRRFEQKVLKVARDTTSDVYRQADCANAARMALIGAARRHQLGRPGFPKYAEQFIVGAARRVSQAMSRKADVTGFAMTSLDRISDLLAPPTRQELQSGWLQSIGLNDRQVTLVCQRYEDELALQDVASIEGTSVSAVSQRLTVIHRKVEQALAA